MRSLIKTFSLYEVNNESLNAEQPKETSQINANQGKNNFLLFEQISTF